MAELGNQFLYLNADSGIPHLTPAKGHFEDLGVHHTSFDQNGEDGAFPLDLSKPIPGHSGTYDVVTNYGVAEHIEDIYECLANIDRFCKPNGLMFHAWPKTGHWPDHGFHYVKTSSFIQLARIAGYDILVLIERPAMGNQVNGWEVHCVMRNGRGGGNFPERKDLLGSVGIYKS